MDSTMNSSSFALPFKSSSSPKPNLIKPPNEFDDKTLDHGGSGDSKEYINEFNALNPFSETSTKSRNVVIPTLKNEWPPLKRMPLDRSDESDLTFETASGLDPLDDLKISSKSREDRPRSASSEVLMLEKLKADLMRLPEDRGFEEFEIVPVESFGAALMGSYGWREGRGIGRNAKEDVEIKEYNGRTGKQGLGFVSDVLRD